MFPDKCQRKKCRVLISDDQRYKNVAYTYIHIICVIFWSHNTFSNNIHIIISLIKIYYCKLLILLQIIWDYAKSVGLTANAKCLVIKDCFTNFHMFPIIGLYCKFIKEFIIKIVRFNIHYYPIDSICNSVYLHLSNIVIYLDKA